MEVTTLGYVMIPITLCLMVAPRHWLLGWVVLLSTFWAGAVIIIYRGGEPFGLQPGYFAGCMFLVREAFAILLRGKIAFSRSVTTATLILAAFTVYAIVTSWAVPNIMRGDVLVLPPRVGLGLDALAPLEPLGTNTTQAMYVLFILLFFIAVANFAATQNVIQSFSRFYLISGAVVVGVGFLQFLSQRFGTPFPYELIFSNRGIQSDFRVWAEWTSGRVTSVFPEASMLAYWLSGLLAFVATQFVLVRADWFRLALFIAAFVAFLMTTSTTAYAMIGIFIVLIGIHTFTRMSKGEGTLTEPVMTLLAVGGALGVLGVVVMAVSGQFGDLLDVLRDATVGKVQTVSFEDRSDSELQSLKLIVETWGMGAGWGSHRSSSLLLSFVANAGVVGTAIMLIFAAKAYRLYRQAVEATRNSPVLRGHLRSVAYSVLAMVLAACISVPDFAVISFWVNVSILIGVSARVVDASRAKVPESDMALQPAR